MPRDHGASASFSASIRPSIASAIPGAIGAPTAKNANEPSSAPSAPAPGFRRRRAPPSWRSSTTIERRARTRAGDLDERGDGLGVELVDHDAVADPGHGRLGIHVQPGQAIAGTVPNVSISGPSSRSGARISSASCLGAEHGAVEDDELPPAERLRDLRQRRDLEHPRRRADRLRRRLRPLDVPRQDLGRALPGPDEHAGDELLDVVERDLDGDDHAEAAAAAAQRPEEVRVLRPVGAHDLHRPR